MNIDVIVPDGKSGDWSVETFTISEHDASMFNMRAALQSGGRGAKSGTYKKLVRNSEVIMSNTQAEIRDHLWFISTAKEGGHILINGLGLGVALTAILESDKVESITIIEKSEDVIKLVSPTFKDDSRVKIIHADAFEWKPPKGIRYSAVWHDIWDYICEDNLPEMHKLHRKYGRRTDWQGSWARDLCKR